jgi:hypothetical protein
MIYPVVVALALAAGASASIYSDNATHQKYMWEQFKKEYNRQYSTMEEESHRFAVFLENLKMADVRNEAERKHGGTAIHGISKFSDLSQAEFESQFLTADVSKKQKNPNVFVPQTVSLTATVTDWSGIYTTAVKDQVNFISRNIIACIRVIYYINL